MVFTKTRLMDFARYRIAGGTDIRKLGIEPYQVIKWEQDAIDRMVRRDLQLDRDIKELSKEQRDKIVNRAQIYIQPFNDIDFITGVADITTEAEVGGLLVETIPLFGSVSVSSIKNPLIWCKSEAELTRAKSKNFGYYALRGNFILTRNTDGALDSLTDTGTIFAAKSPTISTVPRSRVDRLITTLVEFFAESVNIMKAEEEAEK